MSVCVCLREFVCLRRGWGEGAMGPRGPPHLLQLGGPFLSSPSLPACLSPAGALSPRWSWPRSAAPHTLSLSSASPRRLFEARKPWWKMRSRCSEGVRPAGSGEYSGLERLPPPPPASSVAPRKACPGALPGWTGLGGSKEGAGLPSGCPQGTSLCRCRVSHPNIVALEDVHESPSHLYLAMEL